MLVKNWMTKEVYTIDSNGSLQDAIQILKEKNIKMLPVMENGKLVGILSDRDVKRASASDATTLEIHELIYLLGRIKIKDIMSKKPVSVPVDFTIEETAEVLLKNRISGVPVVNNKGDVVGIITKSDLFKVIISLTGGGKRGIQLGFILEDRPGSIKEIDNQIRQIGGRIVSILTSYEHSPEGYRNVYLRIYSVDRQKFEPLLKTFKENKILLYMVDHRENKREIYVS